MEESFSVKRNVPELYNQWGQPWLPIKLAGPAPLTRAPCTPFLFIFLFIGDIRTLT